MDNATFYIFKKSGKYYSQGRGVLPRGLFESSRYGHLDPRKVILEYNQGRMPSLSTTGSEFNVVVILDDTESFGWPLHLNAAED